MDLILIHKIIIILIDVLCIWLGIWVYFSNRKSRINQIFFLWMIINVSWITLSFFSNTSFNHDLALFLAQWAYGIGVLNMIPAYFVSLYLVKEERKYRFLNILVLVTVIVLFLVTVSSSIMVRGVEVTEIGNIPVLGWFRFIFFGVLVFWFSFSLVRIFVGYSGLPSKEERAKIQYFLIGFIAFLVANLVFNVILPLFYGMPMYYYIGNYSVILLAIFAALAIIKRQLFGIKVILTDLLVGIMGVVLFLAPLLIKPIWFKILLFTIFFLFCIISYLLIRYTHREVRQKEILEQKVKERTKEIERRKTDLEKFYKLLVGRELKMVELKKEIKELEGRVKAPED